MASIPKIRVPRGAAPQFSHNALRLMAKAGFSDAIAEKLFQTDQGFARRKIAENRRSKVHHKVTKDTKKKVRKEPPMNADERRSGETGRSELMILAKLISGAPQACQRHLAIECITPSAAF